MSTGFEVPTIDISAFDGDDPAASARVVDAVRAACETVGFFLLADRGGVPEDLVAGALDASRGFFERPLEEKMRVASLRKGYIPVDGCDNAVRPTSLHEKFSCSRVDLDAIDVSDPYYDPSASAQAELYFGEDNRWPDAPGGFRHAWETYYVAMESLTRRLLRIFARALDAKGGDDFFVDRCRRHVSNLVALRYPPLHPDDERHHGAGQTAHGPDRRHHPGVRTRAKRAAGAPGRSRRLDRRAGGAKLTAGQPRGRDAVLDERRVEIHAAQGDVHTAE